MRQNARADDERAIVVITAIAAQTAASVAATAMAVSMTQAGLDAFTAPLSPGLSRTAIARAVENRTSAG